jgi:hypothetical protein
MTTSIPAGSFPARQAPPAPARKQEVNADTYFNAHKVTNNEPFNWDIFLRNLPPPPETVSISNVFQDAVVGSEGNKQSAPGSSPLSNRSISTCEEFGFNAIPGSPFEDDSSSPEGFIRLRRDRSYSEHESDKQDVRFPVPFEAKNTGNPSPNSVAGLPKNPDPASTKSSGSGLKVRFSDTPENRYFFPEAPSDKQSQTLEAAQKAYHLYAITSNAELRARRVERSK